LVIGSGMPSCKGMGDRDEQLLVPNEPITMCDNFFPKLESKTLETIDSKLSYTE
jgi:hypothetical protein